MRNLKRALIFFSVIAIFINMSITNVLAKPNKFLETDINIIIDEEMFKPSIKPIINNGRILVPLRSLFETMDINVEWDNVEKKVCAMRDGNIVQIFINSDIAFINEEEIKLDQPAIIYNDTTYVPLRFIGESFGGNVIWDNATKTAIITTNFVKLPKIREYSNMSIVVNKSKINTYLNPIMNGNTGMVPAEIVLKAMGMKTYIDYTTGELVALKDNEVELRINILDKTVTVNGEYIEPQQEIIDYNETLYVPLKFLEQVFGATVVWDSNAKQVNIYSKESAFLLPFLEKEFIWGGVVPKNVPEPIPEGNTRLMVSDNPEKFNEMTVFQDPAVLWHDIVEEDEEYIRHIVFGYHENKFNEPVTIGITIENLSDTNDIELVDVRGVSRTSNRGWAIYDVGLKVAELSLSGTLPLIPMNTTYIKSGSTQIIDSLHLGSETLIGFQYEFKVKKASGSGKLNYVIRTVVTKGDELSLLYAKGDPLPLDFDNKHPRGTWDFARLTTELPVYEAGDNQVAYSISNKETDNIFSAENSFGKEYGTIGNIGHYGATYKIKIPVVNNTGEEKTIRVRLNPRGGRCAAAVKTEEGYFITPEMSSQEAANIIDYTLEDGEEKVIEFEMMNAGGSSLPIAINIITLD
ncbi:stalk domain-containing protein [Defluviitalea phaphyphila]|uniref:stalk domain-containing protein n=1 Tax=Defluviitalea phaphyphila TaxID=1473580 RepID=UPI0007304F05|nr:stalk domain-containing protein [Defluviitalea phaphyphila]